MALQRYLQAERKMPKTLAAATLIALKTLKLGSIKFELKRLNISIFLYTVHVFSPTHIMFSVDTRILLPVCLVCYLLFTFCFLINTSTNMEVCVSCDVGVNVQKLICHMYDQILHL